MDQRKENKKVSFDVWYLINHDELFRNSSVCNKNLKVRTAKPNVYFFKKTNKHFLDIFDKSTTHAAKRATVSSPIKMVSLIESLFYRRFQLFRKTTEETENITIIYSLESQKNICTKDKVEIKDSFEISNKFSS